MHNTNPLSNFCVPLYTPPIAIYHVSDCVWFLSILNLSYLIRKKKMTNYNWCSINWNIKKCDRRFVFHLTMSNLRNKLQSSIYQTQNPNFYNFFSTIVSPYRPNTNCLSKQASTEKGDQCTICIVENRVFGWLDQNALKRVIFSGSHTCW